MPFEGSPRYILLGRNEAMDTAASWSWLAPGTVLKAGTPTKTSWIVRNPDKTPRRYFATFSVRGGEVAPATALVELGPSEERAVPLTVTR